jgi:uncharacterized protein with NRDE domain
MCLALIAFHPDHHIPLLIAANRDESHARATLAAHVWSTDPEIYAGRDLVAGGTWMGLTRTGRFALITNFRDPSRVVEDAPSRGALVENFLESNASPDDFLTTLQAQGALYNGFNLVVGDRRNAAYYSNRQDCVRRLVPGVYAVSNHLLDTPWPKLTRTKAAFERLLDHGNTPSAPDIEELLTILRDREPAPDSDLPHTGISLERERLLSSPFVVSPTYGTRSSTVAWFTDKPGCTLHEVRFDAGGNAIGETVLNFEGEYDEQRKSSL